MWMNTRIVATHFGFVQKKVATLLVFMLYYFCLCTAAQGFKSCKIVQDTACWWEVFHVHARSSLLARGLAQSRRNLARNKPCKVHKITMLYPCKLPCKLLAKWIEEFQESGHISCKLHFILHDNAGKTISRQCMDMQVSFPWVVFWCT